MQSELGTGAIQRMYNVTNQLILKLIDLDKIVIHGNSGKIISYLLNHGLKDLRDYLEFENQVLSRVIMSTEAWKKA